MRRRTGWRQPSISSIIGLSNKHLYVLRLTYLLIIALTLLPTGAQATNRIRGARKLVIKRAPTIFREETSATATRTAHEFSSEQEQQLRQESGEQSSQYEQEKSSDDLDEDYEPIGGGEGEEEEEASANKPNSDDNNDSNKTESSEEPEEEDDSAISCGLDLLRLSKRVVPIHYDLIVMPDMETLSFEGAVQIDLAVKVQDESSEIRRRREIRQREPLGKGLKHQQREVGQNSNNNLSSAYQKKMSMLNRTRMEPADNQLVLHADGSLTVGNVWYFDFGLDFDDQNSSSNSNSNNNNNNNNNNNKNQARLNSAGSYVEVLSVCQDAEFELLVITLAKDLRPASRGQLHLAFAGNLSEDMRGFYKSAYPSSRTNSTRYHATTQFQATEARRAFPCFDEPALKATFDVALIHPADRLALANMEPKSEQTIVETPKDNETAATIERKLTRFARTPPMSTYLLAFIVGEFDFVERILLGTKRDSRLRVRVYTPLGKSKQGLFALETACRAIVMMQDYFGIDFPLKKLDLVAIPDFDAGAMENWGLITFREGQVLFDELNTTPETKALVASTVVHEIAHQWFGNLVTMEWWNELWLNEGFATWMEYKMSAELYSEFDFQFRYLLDSHIYALTEDSFRSAHPIEPQGLESTSAIDDLFDAISYNKAAAIIRILHDEYLKPQPFREAIRQYLAANKYGNTETTDLWESMELSGQLPVLQFMQSWLSQAGHPLVKLSFDVNSNKLTIEQERFVANPGPLKQEERNQRWIIPFSVIISVNNNSTRSSSSNNNIPQEKHEWLYRFTLDRARGAHFKLPASFNSSAGGNWLKLNSNFSGFYRVQYPDSLYRLLREPIQRKTMLAADRLNILDETCTLAITNRVPAMRLLDTIMWFEHENNGAVLSSLVESYENLAEILREDSNLNEKFRLFGHRFFGKFYSQLGGLDSDSGPMRAGRSHMEMRARAAILNLLVDLNYQPAVSESVKLLPDHANRSNGNLTNPIAAFELRESIYAAIAIAGSNSQQDWLVSKMASTSSREERTRIAVSLARATKPDRLARIWRLLKQKSLAIDLDQKNRAVENMLASKEGLEFVLKLTKEKGRKEVAGLEPLILRELLLAGNITKPDQAAVAYPELLEGASKELAEWPEEASDLIGIRERRLKALRESSNQIEMALDHYLASTARSD